MEFEVAETISRATREEAELRARGDLDQLRRRAVEAGRERSRTVFKVTQINTTTGEISYNPAGRLLRDWYLHVYINSLRANLSQPNEPMNAQEVEEAAALLTRVRHAGPLQALKAVNATQQIATADADAAAAHIAERLRDACALRAIRHAPDERFDGDQLHVHVTRHWYQRCYDDTVDEVVRAHHPLAPVTDTEMLQVARTLASHEARRLIGRDGIPLETRHRAAVSHLDPSLAADPAGVAPASPALLPQHDLVTTVRARVRQAWADMDQKSRTDWLRTAGTRQTPATSAWSGLDQAQQAKLVQHYLETHRSELLDNDPDRPRIEGAAVEAARKMFNHSRPLTAPPEAKDQTSGPVQLDPEGRSVLADVRSPDSSLSTDDARSATRRVQ